MQKVIAVILVILTLTVFTGTAVCEEAGVFSGRGSAWVTDRPVFGILSYCNADEKEVRKLVTSSTPFFK